MCGIAGFFGAPAPSAALRATAEAMISGLTHRGPDDSGVWVDEPAGLGFGFRRLAIQDLSEAGHQPMMSRSGRFVIMLNGEIYNFLEIRALLPGPFKGHSDTEVFVEACEAWGLDEVLRRSVGMFAIALWDRQERCLSLARDRLGEKPLYYSHTQGTLVFGSELRCLAAHPTWRPRLDRRSLRRYMQFGYIEGPSTIYQEVFKLEPGSFISFPEPMAPVTPCRYWKLEDSLAIAGSFDGSREEARDRLGELLMATVKNQMLSDVPLGAFLSGGIDSSAVVAAMQACSPQPIRTFTIGFQEEDYNEARHAADVARHLGTDHTELQCDPSQASALVNEIACIYDEPFADQSQIPTLLVARLARKHVTVALSGDGGDEVFAGYSRYPQLKRLRAKLSKLPKLPGLERAPAGLAAAGLRALGRSGDPRKIRKGLRLIAADCGQSFYSEALAGWMPHEEIALGVNGPPPTIAESKWPDANLDWVEQMMAADTVAYLPDDILVKVDRSSMAVSLESRAPFLDHRIVEFAWTLPLEYKFDGTTTKRVLRDWLANRVPRDLWDRPKTGFGVPMASWLRGPHREWAESLLDPTRLRQDGLLNEPLITRTWNEHLSGRSDHHQRIWQVLMFQGWLERWRNGLALNADR